MFFLVLCFSLSAQEWSVSYAGGYPSGYTHFFDGFIDQDGVTFLIGEEGPDESDPEALLMRIDPHGEHSEIHYRKSGFYTKGTCIIETANHNLFVAGNLYNETSDYLMVLILDKDLNLLEERQYEKEVEGIAFGECKATLDSHGHIIVSTTVAQQNAYNGTDYHGVFFKLDSSGNLISQRYLIEDYPDPLYFFMNFKVRQMWYKDEDETLLCLSPAGGGVMSFVTFDSAFNLMEENPIWRTSANPSDNTLFYDCYTDYWYNDDEALVFSSKGDYDDNKLRVSHINTQGDFLDFICLNERADTIDDAASSRCMATANDSTFFFSFHYHTLLLHPGIACVYQLNDQLEIVGRHLDDDHENYWTSLILPTSDGGCITVNDSCCHQPFGLTRHPVIKKLTPNDFECVHFCEINTPSNQRQPSKPFPNPARKTLNIPMNGIEPSKARCQIIDSKGLVVADLIIDSQSPVLQLDVSRLKDGLYCYRVISPSRILTEGTFIKE